MAILHFKRGEITLSHALAMGHQILASQATGTKLEIYCAGEMVDIIVILTVQADWRISESYDAKLVPQSFLPTALPEEQGKEE